MSLFFSFDRIQLRHAGQKKKPLTGSPATDVGEIFYLSGHTAAPSLPRCSHIHPALPQPPSPSLHIPTPKPPFALSPARVHPPLFIYFIYYLIYFSQNLPPRFEPTSHVGERATLKPPLATGESLFCHAFILASCECRPSHASGEPTGVQMTVLCSQTAMNNETEVMYEVADAGRGGKKTKKRWAPTLANGLSSSIVRLDPCMGETVTKED